MPTYEFKCPDCGQDRLVNRSITNDGIVWCDDCETEMRKRYTPTPAHFTGVGFYTTDKFSDR